MTHSIASDRSFPSRYSYREEIANALTHGAGIVAALAGLVALTSYASVKGTSLHLVSCLVFGFALVLLYTASTLYHSIQQPDVKPVLRIIDHASIFILIAGTYTPFTLVSLQGALGWSLFGVIWGLAVFGILLEIFLIDKWKAGSLVLYAGMGWCITIAIKPLLASLPTGGIVLLFLGGFFYTGGIAFYVWKRLPYNHAIWHLFVLAGSVCHFFSILLFVIPA
ncbi:MAG: hemolysin III family protein [Acidobacteriota bacterium]|nr:hemolysin III family protein [Acidobacteriota bacterium]